MIELLQEEAQSQHIPVARIKVVGVGGAGGNTLNCMVASGYQDVEFIAINTDAQALQMSRAHTTIQIGQKSTKGLGAGANPEVGKRAAEEDLEKVLAATHDADIVFLTGGLGGGTGSGALPVIAQALRDHGILTIVVVTKPFAFEGRRRTLIADQSLERIKHGADTLLVVPNQNLLQLVTEKVSMIQAFEMINDVLNQSVKGVSDIITRPGHINVDFADVREIMKNQGMAVMGTGRASGPNRAQEAALKAISSPLLENMSIKGARGVLLNITGNSDLTLHEISAAASVIYDQADPDANIILGSVIDDSLDEDIFVTVIATGFNEPEIYKEPIDVAIPSISHERRESFSPTSHATSSYKSSYTFSEHKNGVNTPSYNNYSASTIKNQPEKVYKTESFITSEQTQQRAPQSYNIPKPTEEKIVHAQQVAREQFQQQASLKADQRFELRHDLKKNEHTEPLEEVHPAHKEEESFQEHSFHQQSQEYHKPLEASACQEKKASTETKDLETPAYLRKNENPNQHMNWNKFNNKKFKKHKFQ